MVSIFCILNVNFVINIRLK